jgi:4-hydroxybenzoate polyprenyltransferase
MDFWDSCFSNRFFRRIIHPLIGLFSVTRAHNILMVVTAQYLVSVFVFKPNQPLLEVVLDLDLFFVVLASGLVIAAGYIINGFYDEAADRINKPLKSRLDNMVSQTTKLRIYFAVNFLGVLLGFLVSWRAALFFTAYIFLIWLYSHKFKKKPFWGMIVATSLSLLPFFVVFVYHKHISRMVFVHAFFLFCVLVIRELLKELENLQGAFVQNYQTFAVKYGERSTKSLISLTVLMTLWPVCLLWQYPEMGLMKYYFYLVFLAFPLLVFFLWKAQSKKAYNQLHNLVKILIVLGVFSLVLIDTSVLIDRILSTW